MILLYITVAPFVEDLTTQTIMSLKGCKHNSMSPPIVSSETWEWDSESLQTCMHILCMICGKKLCCMNIKFYMKANPNLHL